jgi:hypothetical protein
VSLCITGVINRNENLLPMHFIPDHFQDVVIALGKVVFHEGGFILDGMTTIPSFLPLSATAQGELWPPEQSASILLYSSSILLILSLSGYGSSIPAPLLMSISVQSIHQRLIIWFLNNLVFTV